MPCSTAVLNTTTVLKQINDTRVPRGKVHSSNPLGPRLLVGIKAGKRKQKRVMFGEVSEVHVIPPITTGRRHRSPEFLKETRATFLLIRIAAIGAKTSPHPRQVSGFPGAITESTVGCTGK